jgi:ribosomal protein S18 acetylase RimI-like enzyme
LHDPTITVRAYQVEDELGVVALWNDVFPGDPPGNAPQMLIANKLSVQPHLFLVARQGEVVVGAVMAGFDGVRGWIHHLAVTPSARRRGLGRRLMREAESGLRELGCPKVNLQVRATNQSVVAFYESLGYSVEERVSLGRRL